MGIKRFVVVFDTMIHDRNRTARVVNVFPKNNRSENTIMPSWTQKVETFIQWLCIKLLLISPLRIPNHIAIIMDGNRRYSKRINSKVSVGHSKGSDVLSETMQWCIDLGIEELTVYAFSIENFKRSEEEVNALMDLTREKFQSFQDNIDKINSTGIRVQVVGRLSLLPSDIQSSISRVMLATRNNKTMRVNIAFAYTARDEISRAATHIVDAVRNKELTLEDIDADLISKTLDLGEPELLIRTSGEVRLSDFMLWQVSNTVLYFTEVLWPEFSIWNLFAAIFYFQRQVPAEKVEERKSDTILNFLNNLERKRWQEVETFVAC